MKTVVLFGGTGFIGTHLTQHLLKHNLAETIYLVDLNGPRDFPYTQLLHSGLSSGKVLFVAHDVRKPVPLDLLPDKADVVFNLAAVHREPGHSPQEYFETNLLGAENVCAWASTVASGEAGKTTVAGVARTPAGAGGSSPETCAEPGSGGVLGRAFLFICGWSSVPEPDDPAPAPRSSLV